MKLEVELVLFLRMRGNSSAKKDESALKNAVRKPNFSRLYAFRHGESEFEVYF